jgi:ABC transport system ATP-binding/permease protein
MPTPSRPSDHTQTIGGKKRLLPAGLGAVLEFTDGDEKGRKVPLMFERTILGRKFGDILVRDIIVSGTHLAIEYRAGSFRVVDLGSSNGTFVEGRRVKEQAVQLGQEVRMGECAFRLKLDPAEAERLLEEQPVRSGTAQSGLSDLIEKEFIRGESGGDTLMIGASPEKAVKHQIRVRIVNGPDRGKNFTFSKSSVVIGRMNADLTLHDPDVSRKHAMLERGEGGQVILRDLASANGTFVNQRSVANCVLAPNDQIKVGQTTIIFQGVEGE